MVKLPFMEEEMPKVTVVGGAIHLDLINLAQDGASGEEIEIRARELPNGYFVKGALEEYCVKEGIVYSFLADMASSARWQKEKAALKAKEAAYNRVAYDEAEEVFEALRARVLSYLEENAKLVGDVPECLSREFLRPSDGEVFNALVEIRILIAEVRKFLYERILLTEVGRLLEEMVVAKIYDHRIAANKYREWREADGTYAVLVENADAYLAQEGKKLEDARAKVQAERDAEDRRCAVEDFDEALKVWEKKLLSRMQINATSPIPAALSLDVLAILESAQAAIDGREVNPKEAADQLWQAVNAAAKLLLSALILQTEELIVELVADGCKPQRAERLLAKAKDDSQTLGARLSLVDDAYTVAIEIQNRLLDQLAIEQDDFRKRRQAIEEAKFGTLETVARWVRDSTQEESVGGKDDDWEEKAGKKAFKHRRASQGGKRSKPPASREQQWEIQSATLAELRAA